MQIFLFFLLNKRVLLEIKALYLMFKNCFFGFKIIIKIKKTKTVIKNIEKISKMTVIPLI